MMENIRPESPQTDTMTSGASFVSADENIGKYQIALISLCFKNYLCQVWILQELEPAAGKKMLLSYW